MTYRVDSDILFPYGEVLDATTRQVIAPAMNIKWKKPEENFTGEQEKKLRDWLINLHQTDDRLLEIVRNKTTIASWLLSNCDDTKSFRNEFAKSLQKCGIKIDIIGRCGEKTLKFHDRFPEAVKAKFYMAFENSLCTDYLTEKVYKMHNQDIIPVVYSGGECSL
jgi:alpha-1,3-fucosyltransferase